MEKNKNQMIKNTKKKIHNNYKKIILESYCPYKKGRVNMQWESQSKRAREREKERDILSKDNQMYFV